MIKLKFQRRKLSAYTTSIYGAFSTESGNSNIKKKQLGQHFQLFALTKPSAECQNPVKVNSESRNSSCSTRFPTLALICMRFRALCRCHSLWWRFWCCAAPRKLTTAGIEMLNEKKRAKALSGIKENRMEDD